jgi:hypothetical protein
MCRQTKSNLYCPYFQLDDDEGDDPTAEEPLLPDWCDELFTEFWRTPHQVYNVSEEEADFYVHNVVLDNEKAKKLCQLTIDQSRSQLWKYERKFRVTASKGHKIVRARTDKKQIDYFFESKSIGNLASIRYGILNEPHAFKKFCEVTRHNVVSVGLVVKPDQCWIAASPDGIYQDVDGTISVLEIKCPSSCQDLAIIDVPYIVEGKLKKTDCYYTQIQLTMYVCGAKRASLFVYSAQDFKLVNVDFDQDFC